MPDVTHRDGETSTALVPVDSSLQPGTLAELQTFAREFAESALLPKHLRGRPADLAITILYGRELNLTPMQAVQGIHVIEGRPSVSASLAVALVKRSPLCEFFDLVESTPMCATYETQRKGGRKPAKMSFTLQEANAAGLTGKDNWKKYPAAMLRNRAALALARDVYPDVVANIISDDEADDLRPPLGHVAPPPPPAASAPPAKGWEPPAGAIEATANAAGAQAPKTMLERIAATETVEQLAIIAAELSASPPPQGEQAAIGKAYRERKAALTPKPAPAPAPAAASPQESAKWGEISEAGATPVEREVGADDE